jgi:hypothetical protein
VAGASGGEGLRPYPYPNLLRTHLATASCIRR